MKRARLRSAPNVCYKLAYVAGETRRLKEEITALDVSAAVQAVLLSALQAIELRAAELRRATAVDGH